MRLAIISDTHMPKGVRALPVACWNRLEQADAIVHAGDFVEASVLEALEALGRPVHAVHGNVDEPRLRDLLPETRELEREGVRIAVIHDAGPAAGRARRLRARFPLADAVIFGHSHMPLLETGPDGLVILNPGSPTERRRAARHTMALADITGGHVEFELIPLD